MSGKRALATNIEAARAELAEARQRQAFAGAQLLALVSPTDQERDAALDKLSEAYRDGISDENGSYAGELAEMVLDLRET